jgi:radical SAM superfamily enzyme YgiQ (UPF0313 family)
MKIEFVNKDFKEILIKKIKKNTKTKTILLIDCNVPTKRTNVNYSFGPKSSGFTPFGLKRIESYLSGRGVITKVVHIYEIENKLSSLKNWDIIGINSLSPSVDYAFKLAIKIKKKYPEKLIIGGAEHFALDYQWILENKPRTGMDCCCTMQGEPVLLALANNFPLEDIGSIAYVKKNKIIINNNKYCRLNDSDESKFFRPSPIDYKDFISQNQVMPELSPFFKNNGSTQTGSGCNYACTFCTNAKFLGKYISTLETAKIEVESIQENKIEFLYVRDAMVNSDKKHFDSFVKHMMKINSSNKQKIAWFAYTAANKEISSFKKLAKAGCIMAGVGIEDVLGNRRQLGKGSDLDFCTDFINKAKKYLLVRALLILGLPSHYSLTKKEIKERTLEYMKTNPQAIYRINILSVIPGTVDWGRLKDTLIYDFRKEPSKFRLLDNMHSVMSPTKMRKKIEIEQLNNNPDYVQNHTDWYSLRDEILEEYLNSKEHKEFLQTLKNKAFLGRKNLLYDIAQEFQNITLKGIK